MLPKVFWGTLCIFLNTLSVAFGQQPASDTLLVNTQNLFFKAIGPQAEIYNGVEYEPYRPSKGSPYFLDHGKTVAGTLNYNGTLYNQVFLLYDVYKDVLIARLYNGVSNYVLRSDKVVSFYFLGHHFVHISAADYNNSIKDGYYDEVYSGASQVVIKWVKSRTEVLLPQGAQIVYTDESSLYLKKGNAYYPVGSKGSVMKVFADKARELKQYLKNNPVNFDDDRQAAIISLATYYDQISH